MSQSSHPLISQLLNLSIMDFNNIDSPVVVIAKDDQNSSNQKSGYSSPPPSTATTIGTTVEPIQGKRKHLSLGLSFICSVRQLLQELQRSSHISFVRCLKPNDRRMKFMIDKQKLEAQLRYSGIPALVKTMKLGFPCRTSIQTLVNRILDIEQNEGNRSSNCSINDNSCDSAVTAVTESVEKRMKWFKALMECQSGSAQFIRLLVEVLQQKKDSSLCNRNNIGGSDSSSGISSGSL